MKEIDLQTIERAVGIIDHLDDAELETVTEKYSLEQSDLIGYLLTAVDDYKNENLKIIYTLLHSDGNPSSSPYLNIDSVDYCTFGNSKPFRIKIRNIVIIIFQFFNVKKLIVSKFNVKELNLM